MQIRQSYRLIRNWGVLLAGLCTAAVGASAAVYADGGGLISMEAEKGAVINRSGEQWTVSKNSYGYSGTGFLLPSPATGKTYDPTYVGVAPEVQFQVNFKTLGTYYVWVRGAGNSVHAGLDGVAVSTASRISRFNSQWNWSNTRLDGSRATINVTTAGVHTINVWMDVDTLWFDKIVLVQWSGYTLGGTGPNETPIDTTVTGTTTTSTSGTTTGTTTGTSTGTTTGTTTTTTTSAGSVAPMKLVGPPYDSYISTTNTTLQQFQTSHISRMVAFYPSFNSTTSWYGNGLMYADSYAIYPGGTFGENVTSTHPEWIMKDQGGRWLFIPWGCGGGTCPQYAADFSNPAYQQWWISKVKAQLGAGKYKGVFIDDVNFDWRVGDGNGNFVTPWDRNTNAPMTITAWRSYFATFLEAVRAGLPGYEICHNSIWYAGGDNGRDSDPNIQRQIAAADDIFIEFGINDGGLTGGTGLWSVDAVLAYVERVNAKGKHPVIANIGGGSTTDRVALEFAVAGSLLANNGNNYVADAYGANVIDPNNWWPGFDAKLGSATGARYSWNGLMRRDFSSGMVLMNYPGNPTVTVTLPGSYKRVDGSWVTSVTLGARQAVILSK